ncbi:hypothetical protein ABZV54_40820, partial [Streptomyces sp. NPDC005096]
VHGLTELPLHPLAASTRHWMLVRSTAKAYGPAPGWASGEHSQGTDRVVTVRLPARQGDTSHGREERDRSPVAFEWSPSRESDRRGAGSCAR